MRRRAVDPALLHGGCERVAHLVAELGERRVARLDQAVLERAAAHDSPPKLRERVLDAGNLEAVGEVGTASPGVAVPVSSADFVVTTLNVEPGG